MPRNLLAPKTKREPEPTGEEDRPVRSKRVPPAEKPPVQVSEPGNPRASVAPSLLALQRSAGNRAVLAVLRAAPTAPPQPAIQRKAKFNKTREKWESDHPALLNQLFDSKEKAEKAEQTAKENPIEAPKAVTRRDDGSGPAFEKVKSKEEERQEAREQVDVDALVTEVNDYQGKVAAIGVRFNQLVNAMEAQGLLQMGAITAKYLDKGGPKWSVAVSLNRLPNWEIHAHCDLEGNTARGENAMHFKRVRERFSRGVSVALTSRQEGLLMPAAADRKAARFAG